ncbi:hypothetical protein B5X24_HaOG203914 [Helicoverpa armigera]|uniref:Ubiquitin-like domain-containing protein n=1 Tax=Helicoverpa armigera TaxID=29058 RepID=A0A2W1BTK9_HELAM|nr:hypothetical protein B5X24_HaOG203914 [Helicoverpa armigera]
MRFTQNQFFILSCCAGQLRMPLIEGIGDEVVQFVAVVLVIVIAAVAWWSTNAQPDRYRAVLVMRSRTNHPVTVSIRTRSNLMITAEPAPSIQAALSDGPMPTAAEAANEDTSRVIPLQEMDSIVDADMAMLDNNRLHFYRRVDSNNTQTAPESTSDESEVHEEVEPATNVEKSSETATTDNVMPTEGAGDVTAEEQESRRILIKLKYLNDTLKEVEGSLDELLKDFKWRHFSTELTAECRVRLIFNGRVLLDDAATLRACGLHDRAVVHCLVHPKRTVNQQRGSAEEGAGAAPELVSERAAPERAWDLENILMTLVSVALTVVWFFRCEYSNLFTASASLALFGLTVFYSVAIFGLYLSDTFQFDRRPPQPVPDN